MNRFFLSLTSYRVDPRYLDEPGTGLGAGIDLRDPLHPVVAPRRGLEAAPAARGAPADYGLVRAADVIEESTTLFDSLTERDESQVLSGYFKASYGLSSIEASLERTREVQSSYHTVYALLDHVGESDRLPEDLRCWRADEVPVSEGLADREQAAAQFVATYGSHYVSAVRHGLRIAIQGKVRRDSSTSATKLATEFKAAFGSFGADGAAREGHKQSLASMSIDLVLEATSGGHRGGGTGGLLVLRGFDDIAGFLEDLKRDKIQFAVAPIEMTLKPMWPMLRTDWVNTRRALDPADAGFKVPLPQYGVPKGTILAWRPTPDFVQGLGSREQCIVAPDGWALCDGSRGTPDLRERFLRGTALWSPVPATGGTAQHDHGGTAQGNTDKRDAHGGAGSRYWQPAEVHTHPIAAASHLPPYAEVVYIMKLDDHG